MSVLIAVVPPDPVHAETAMNITVTGGEDAGGVYEPGTAGILSAAYPGSAIEESEWADVPYPTADPLDYVVAGTLGGFATEAMLTIDLPEDVGIALLPTSVYEAFGGEGEPTTDTAFWSIMFNSEYAMYRSWESTTVEVLADIEYTILLGGLEAGEGTFEVSADAPFTLTPTNGATWEPLVLDDSGRRYLVMDHPLGDDYRSQVFSGNFVWSSVIPDQADTLTIRLRRADDDSDVATATLTVA